MGTTYLTLRMKAELAQVLSDLEKTVTAAASRQLTPMEASGCRASLERVKLVMIPEGPPRPEDVARYARHERLGFAPRGSPSALPSAPEQSPVARFSMATINLRTDAQRVLDSLRTAPGSVTESELVSHTELPAQRVRHALLRLHDRRLVKTTVCQDGLRHAAQ